MEERKRKKPSGIRQKFLKRMKKKLVLLFGAIILAFIGLIARVTYINATNGEKYTKIVLDQQEYNSRLIPFKRGDILDRNGTVVATSERVYNVILDAYVMLSKDDKTDRETIVQNVVKRLKKEKTKFAKNVEQNLLLKFKNLKK